MGTMELIESANLSQEKSMKPRQSWGIFRDH